MSALKLANQLRLTAELANSDKVVCRRGNITAYNPNTYQVKVMIQPDQFETGWLPLGTPLAGSAWGFFFGPPIGAQATILLEFGVNITATVVCLTVNNDFLPPAPIPSGEAWLVSQSGCRITLGNNGDLLVQSFRDLYATSGRDLIATVAGDMTSQVFGDSTTNVSGDMTANVTGSINATAASADLTVEGDASVTASSITLAGDSTLDGSLAVTGNLSSATAATGTFLTLTGSVVNVVDGIVTNIL